MPEFGYAGLPVQNEDEIARRRLRNAEWDRSNSWAADGESDPLSPSLAGLLDPYADEPTTEELLAQAQHTLDETQPTANLLRGAELGVSNPGDDAAAREQGRTERESSREYRNAVLSPLAATSFIPGPIGAASQGALSLAGLYDAADSDLSTGERVTGGALGALGISPAAKAIRGLRGVPESMPRMPEPGMNWTAREPAERAYRFQGDMPASVTPEFPRHQINMSDGSGWKLPTPPPSKPLGSASGQQFTDTLPPRQGPAGAASASAQRPSLRALSEGEEQGVSELDTLISDIYGSAGRPNTKGGLYREPSVGAMMDPQRLSALEALAAMDEPSRRSILMGGVGSRDAAGNLIRINQRTPIGR